MPRLGVALNGDSRLRESMAIAVEAEALGYSDVWSAEVNGTDAFTPLASLVPQTTTLRLGTAVVPSTTRPPALLAMTAATMQELSGGRFVLGLGASTAAIVNSWMGLDFPPPLGRMRETLSAIRTVLSGEKAQYSGKSVKISGFALQLTGHSVPLYIGALGPRMTRLAGEMADGLIMAMASVNAIHDLLGDFRAGAKQAGREVDDLDVVLSLPVLLDGSSPSLDRARANIAAYAVLPDYNRHLERQGFEVEAAAFRNAWTERSRRLAMDAVSEHLMAELCVVGDEGACRERLSSYREAGVQTLVLDFVIAEEDPTERRRQLMSALSRLAGS